jgi:hypothetical protein
MKLHSPRALASAATSWHVTSQQQSRRNALVASTALAQRRKEQSEVEEFLAELDAASAARRRTALPTTLPTALPAAVPAQQVRRTRSA